MNVRLVAAFVAGILVGAIITALVFGSEPNQRARAGGVWRERAERSEREAMVAKRHLETLTNELRQLQQRFDALTARLEAIQPPPPAATP